MEIPGKTRGILSYAGAAALVRRGGVWYNRIMREYEVKRSRRRTTALEITNGCKLVVRVPLGMSDREVEAYVARHRDWIEQALARQRARAAAAPPPPTEEEIRRLKERARAVLPEKVAYWSRKTGLIPTGVRITAARTRYGSCSGKNSLSFSCFLMNAPEEAIDLVVVHELCHIRHKNHGPGFYALLESILPDHRQRRELLRPVMPRER